MDCRPGYGDRQERRAATHLHTGRVFRARACGHVRREYWNAEIICVSGGSLAHAQLCGNIHFRLRQQLSGRADQAFTSELPVKTHTLLPYCYPDITVVCGDLVVENMRGIDALVNPTLIVEVLSPASEERDRQDKFTAYEQIASFCEYLLVAQDKPYVTHYRRQQDGKWVRDDISNVDGALTLSSIGCTLTMREIYEDVAFAAV